MKARFRPPAEPRAAAHASVSGRRPGAARSSLGVLVVLSAIVAACLGALPHDRATRQIVESPGQALELPMYEQRRHWLLRDLPRWCGAAEAHWGGGPGDPAVLTARAVRFRDETAAARALDKLTPEYLAVAFRDRIADGPRPVDYAARLPGDEAKVNEYRVQLPPENAELVLFGQYTAVRSGKVVMLTESIGVPPERLVPAFEAMVQAAAGAQEGC